MIVRRLSRLYAFDAHGRFEERRNVTLVTDAAGILLEILDADQTAPSIANGETHGKAHGEVIEAAGLLGLPPFIEAHTHALFAGERSGEFLMKAAGRTYAEIAAAGGGILSTRRMTAAASDEELLGLLLRRLEAFRVQGFAGVEVKTGYGLSHDEEIRHLRLIRQARDQLAGNLRVWITYLGPHAVPREVSKEAYLEEILERTLPQVAAEGLADFVDIFVDRGFFSFEDARRFFARAHALGLRLKAHVDELENLGACELASELPVVSLDHCSKTTDEELQLLKERGTVPVLLPLTAFYLGAGTTTMERLRRLGVEPAISTDYNPGSQPGLSAPFLLHIAFRHLKMSEEEALAGLTTRALAALDEDLADWCLEPGRPLRLALFAAGSIAELGYRYGENLHLQTLLPRS